MSNLTFLLILVLYKQTKDIAVYNDGVVEFIIMLMTRPCKSVVVATISIPSVDSHTYYHDGDYNIYLGDDDSFISSKIGDAAGA